MFSPIDNIASILLYPFNEYCRFFTKTKLNNALRCLKILMDAILNIYVNF